MSNWEISPKDVQTKLQNGAKLLLVDCREPWEFETCRIEGAQLMPKASVPLHIRAIEAADEVVVYCHHGRRSLDDVLRRYVEYTKSMAQLRRKIRGALTYPVILLCAAFLLIGVLTTFVIPQFTSLYENMGSELPGITTLVVGISSAIRDNIVWLGPVVAGAIFGLYSWRRTENGRRTMDRWILKVPIVGDLIRQMTTAQLSRSLATLLAGGITVVESFQISLASVANRELLRSTEPALSKIREGKPFTESLAGAGWVPELAVDMIGVGERSGSLREMLDEVAGFYDAETEVKLGQLTTFIEPAILVTMGGIVVTILLAIYLPLLQMVSKAG